MISNSDSGRQASNGRPASPFVHCVDSLRGVAIAQIAAGSQHGAALSVSGALFLWGCNRYDLVLAESLYFCGVYVFDTLMPLSGW